jgi:hypothetical protein
MPVSISGTNGVTFPDSSLQAAAASPYTLKNKIINGDMRIDQRNAGASVTPSVVYEQYTLDRWVYIFDTASKISIQQNAASVTPPAGFTNYLGATTVSAYSVTSGNFLIISQKIEGYNFADMAWGTANAKTVTLSFWVRSSLTGTFGGALRNGNASRSYPFSYTISVANTWEQKTITIAGDTSGTWLTTNGIGVEVHFGIGVGSTYSGTAGSWAGANYLSATGAVSVVGTSGATWYVTGTQLEIGTSATPFERRLYNQELANCQRYYQISKLFPCVYNSAASVVGSATFKCTMRTIPTAAQQGVFQITSGTADLTQSAVSLALYDGDADFAFFGLGNFTGLVAGQAYIGTRGSANKNGVTLSAEL